MWPRPALADESFDEMTHSMSSGFTPYSCCRNPRIHVSEVDEYPGVATFFSAKVGGLCDAAISANEDTFVSEDS